MLLLPCSFSESRRVFPQSIQSWCQKDRSKNSGSLSWSGKLSLWIPRYRPAESTLPEGSPRSAPALYRYILRETKGGKEIHDRYTTRISGKISGKRRMVEFISSALHLIWGALTFQKGLQESDVLSVLLRVRFVECDVQWIRTNHQACNRERE